MRRRSLHTTPLPVLRVHESLLLCAKALQKASHTQHTATLSHPCIAHTPNRLATPRAHMRRPTHTCLAHSLALPPSHARALTRTRSSPLHTVSRGSGTRTPRHESQPRCEQRTWRRAVAPSSEHVCDVFLCGHRLSTHRAHPTISYIYRIHQPCTHATLRERPGGGRGMHACLRPKKGF